MKACEFWEIYNKYCAKNITPNFNVKDHPVGGDSGYFEVGVFQNEEGIWCIERTIERSNCPHHDEYTSEEECFSAFLCLYGSQLTQIGFPGEML